MFNIILDIDDVVLDTQAAVKEFLRTKNIEYSAVRFKRGFIDFSHDWMDELCASRFFGEIPFLNNADEALARLKAAGHKLFALTSPPESGQENRKAQLSRDLPDTFAEVVIKSGHKGEIISDIIARHDLCASDTYFIDDAPHNIEAALSVPDLNVVWMKNDRNKDFPPESTRVITVRDMLEFERVFL